MSQCLIHNPGYDQKPHPQYTVSWTQSPNAHSDDIREKKSAGSDLRHRRAAHDRGWPGRHHSCPCRHAGRPGQYLLAPQRSLMICCRSAFGPGPATAARKWPWPRRFPPAWQAASRLHCAAAGSDSLRRIPLRPGWPQWRFRRPADCPVYRRWHRARAYHSSRARFRRASLSGGSAAPAVCPRRPLGGFHLALDLPAAKRLTGGRSCAFRPPRCPCTAEVWSAPRCPRRAGAVRGCSLRTRSGWKLICGTARFYLNETRDKGDSA